MVGECEAKCNYQVNATTTNFGTGYDVCHKSSNNTANVKLYQLDGTCSGSAASETFTNLVADGVACYHSSQMNFFTIKCHSQYTDGPNYNDLPGFILKGYSGPSCTSPTNVAQYTIMGGLDVCDDVHMQQNGYFSFGSNFTTGGVKVQCNLFGKGLNTSALHR